MDSDGQKKKRQQEEALKTAHRRTEEELRKGNPVVVAHKRHSSLHRQEIIESERVGCFFCVTVFEPSKITGWIDKGQTATCPECGIDSIVSVDAIEKYTSDGDATKFLKRMQRYWFASLNVPSETQYNEDMK